jgi:hypothetical protein
MQLAIPCTLWDRIWLQLGLYYRSHVLEPCIGGFQYTGATTALSMHELLRMCLGKGDKTTLLMSLDLYHLSPSGSLIFKCYPQ